MKIKAIALALAAGFCAAGAQAADNVGRPYAFVTLGQSQVEMEDTEEYYEAQATDLNSIPGVTAEAYTDDTALAFATGAGFQFNRFLAVEGFYRYYGTVEAGVEATDGFDSSSEKDEFSAAGIGAGVIGFLPVSEVFSFYGRADLVLLTAKDEYSYDDTFGFSEEWSTEDTNLKLGVGLGMQFNFGRFSLRGDVQHIEAEIDNEDVSATADIDSLNVTGLLSF